MYRKAAIVGVGLLLLVGGGSLLRNRRPETPAATRSPETAVARCFATAEEARQFAVARLWASQGTSPAGDPYSATFTRRFMPLSGGTLDYYLVHEPARELALADGFLEHGFSREALSHLDAVITFHAGSPEAEAAKGRLEAFRKASVLGLVPPLSVVVRDPQGQLYLPAAVARVGPPALDRIQEAWLGPAVAVEGPFQVAGFVDDAGRIVLRKTTLQEAEEHPYLFHPDAPETFGPEHEGQVMRAHAYYRVGRGANLFELEASAKRSLLMEWVRQHGLADPALAHRVADALLYAGLPDDAAETLAKACEVPPVPSTGPPLRLDALWQAAVDDHPRFTLSTKSSVTTGAEVPMEIDAHAIREMTFSFARLEGPIPPMEAALKVWLAKAPSKLSHTETLALPSDKGTLRLPVREVGSYRVTAEARGLACSFIAVRTDLSIEILAFPGETLFSAARDGVTIASDAKVLGTTEKDGLLSFQGGVLGKFCDAHRECCSGCESCLHHHTDEAVVNSGARVLISGRGQFFRATAKIDSGEVAKHRAPPPSPILLVYTDRPAYKAGDTMRFRGILRLPKQPLRRTDAARLDPAQEREVALSIRCGDASLFQRTYVTGEYGTFSGEFTLPLTASRAEYTLEVTHADAKLGQTFQVMDYRKSDYSIALTPEAGGVRVEAGYVWGAPVTGATVRCTIGGKDVEIKEGLVPMKDGQRVTVKLLRGEEELAQKSLTLRARPAPPAEAAAKPPDPAAPAAVEPAAPVAEQAAPAVPFTLKTSQPLYRRGETIEVELSGPWDDAEAVVVLGDSQLYDLARVPVRNGRGVARFPTRPLHDPGVTAFAICNGMQARTEIKVRTGEMAVSIEAPAKARPGERIDVTLRADPKAALSLAAVDEAIYMIAEDGTPEMYAHFYIPRPAAIAWGRCDGFEYDGETHKVEKPIEGPCFRTGDRVKERLARNAGVYDTVGIGPGGGGGGRYGGRFGGNMNLVAMGGGTRATESACLACLKGLAALQRADGSWPSTLDTPGGTISDTGATALCLLSYLGAGYSRLSRDEYPDPAHPGAVLKFGEIVKNATSWLTSHQGTDGCFGPASGDVNLNHALASLALSEHYGMTASAPLKEPAQRAIEYLGSRQSDDGGWHRSGPQAPGEILATVFAVMALKSAQLSDLQLPPVDRPWQFFSQVVDDDGLCGTPPTRATVGGALLAQFFLRQDRGEPRLGAAAAWLLNQKPDWAQGDFLGWYLATLGLFQFDGPAGPAWTSWNEPLKNALVPNQKTAKDGSMNGLWTVRNESIIHTALGALTLEVYYRYANVFGAGGGRGAALPLAGKPRIRLYFPDTAFWAPELVTDDRGEARVSFTLPDQITTTRLTARGITKDSAVGQAVARIAARQPFFVKACAPEFVVLGDEIEVRVEAYNYTSADFDATLRLEGQDEVKRVRVATDRPSSVSWRVRAGDPSGLRLVAHGRAGEREDSMERVVPVRRPGREVTATARGEARTGQVFSFEAPAQTEDLVVKIHPRLGSLSQLLDALRYLNAYPYG